MQNLQLSSKSRGPKHAFHRQQCPSLARTLPAICRDAREAIKATGVPPSVLWSLPSGRGWWPIQLARSILSKIACQCNELMTSLLSASCRGVSSATRSRVDLALNKLFSVQLQCGRVHTNAYHTKVSRKIILKPLYRFFKPIYNAYGYVHWNY